MARNIFSNLWDRVTNKFNYSFMSQFGGEYTSYDVNGHTYLDKGYNYNNVVYSIINKQSVKTASIPFYIKKVKDSNAKKQLDNLYKSTKGDFTATQRIKKKQLEYKAFDEELLDLPLERPNVTQSWIEFNYLYKTFLKTNGNVYIYMLMPEEGMNKGVPIAVYLLPSQDVKIVTKEDVNMLGIESPIDSYMLIQGKQYIEFNADNVYHIKYANPNYDENGEHLYGVSPLRASLRNLQNLNLAIDLNNKTLESGGAFGFFFGKNQALTPEQAKGFKEKMQEMEVNPGKLAKIAGSSVELGYQRISLTADELKPFDYLQYNEKQMCNALGYNDKLLNSDDGAKYDNVGEFRKQVITDDIKPDLMMLELGFWKPFLAKFKGYENVVLEYDISELPEMQADMVQLSTWSTLLQDRGDLNGDEVREMFNFPSTGLPEHNIYTVAQDVMTLEEAIESDFNIEQPAKE